MQSNQINKVMKFLTILSILALPATTIASIYGMNFWIPEIHWHYGYWYSLIVMALITGALLLYMRLHGWFH
jgi:magnesium transporter